MVTWLHVFEPVARMDMMVGTGGGELFYLIAGRKQGRKTGWGQGHDTPKGLPPVTYYL
jgi:hypothetical protein